MESLTLKDSIRIVQDEILNAVEALFARRLAEEGVTVNFLRDRLHEYFFVESFSKAHLENVSLFSSTMWRTQELVAEWEKFFSTCEEEIALMEFRMESVPSVSVGELMVVVARFVAYAINECDNGHLFLDEKLLTQWRMHGWNV